MNDVIRDYDTSSLLVYDLYLFLCISTVCGPSLRLNQYCLRVGHSFVKLVLWTTASLIIILLYSCMLINK